MFAGLLYLQFVLQVKSPPNAVPGGADDSYENLCKSVLDVFDELH